MKKVNCLINPMRNDYGSVYGDEYIVFPEAEVECREGINEPYFTYLTKDQIKALKEEKRRGNRDVWSQLGVTEVQSVEEALNIFYEG